MAENDFKINNNYQKVIGDSPKVGIRPVIDGREKGVRESLENQTMGMAKSAVDLIRKNLKYPGGKPVECVIADSTIGSVAEAACAENSEIRCRIKLTVTHAGATGVRPLIWILKYLKPYGDLMALKGPGLFIWQQHLLVIQ
jgi:L-fucose isomerase